MSEPRKAVRSNPECTISVRVVTRSSKISISQEADGLYKIKLTAPPVEGEANDQLLQVLARRLHVPPRQLQIASGNHSRMKRIVIAGMTGETVSRLLSDPS